ncbi:MAG: hypothetical protein GON13_02020 [Nanoarchaeota archaeon]|nr:hypothetical protein [Nanoarchaeota archaeon]
MNFEEIIKNSKNEEEFIGYLENSKHSEDYKVIFNDKILGGNTKRKSFWKYLWKILQIKELDRKELIYDFKKVFETQHLGYYFLSLPIVNFYALKALTKIRFSGEFKNNNFGIINLETLNHLMPENNLKEFYSGKRPDVIIFVDVGARAYGSKIKNINNLIKNKLELKLKDDNFYFAKIKLKKYYEFTKLLQKFREKNDKIKNILIIDDLIHIGETAKSVKNLAERNKDFNILFTTIFDLIAKTTNPHLFVQDIHGEPTKARTVIKEKYKKSGYKIEKPVKNKKEILQNYKLQNLIQKIFIQTMNLT